MLITGKDLRTRMSREEAKDIYDKVAEIGRPPMHRSTGYLIHSSLFAGSQALDRTHGQLSTVNFFTL